MSELNRRKFLAATACAPLIAAAQGGPQRGADGGAQATQRNAGEAQQRSSPNAPVAISSANGLRTVTKAVEMMRAGSDPLDAIVAGINIVEDDPEDMSVGLGGLPNENGVVELDASCMHGPSHKAGAVAALQNVRNAASVALQVLRRTDHVLLVGAGALDFARKLGFQEENLLTEKSREAWLKWKADLNKDDDWLDRDQQIPPTNLPARPATDAGAAVDVPFTWGTIHCSAVNAAGDLSACTSTSGLSWKLPGRVGDSPIVGAGMFCDNAVGCAGATGRGEAVIQSCGAFQIVQHMANGIEPSEACMKVLKWIADHTKQSYLLDDNGRPNFGVTLYALRKDGAYGSATMIREKRPNAGKFAVHDEKGARLIDCPALFE